MTIEQLIQCDAATLEKMTPEQLTLHYLPLLKITRPELVEKQSRQRASKQMELLSPEEAAKKQKIKDILSELGVDQSDMDL